MNETVRFGPFRASAARRELWMEDGPVTIGARALDVLIVLLRRPGELVSKGELIDAVWAGAAVEDNAIAAQISALRRALDEGRDGARYVQTVPGRGYRFVATVATCAASESAAYLTAPLKPSIAVLPFANLTGDAEQNYFADGMVEEIVAALTRFRSLFVIASGSGLSFKGMGASPQEAALALGVRYILEGSVRRSAGRVRIAVKLSDAVEGQQIWADHFDDTIEDVFALQDRVALSVVGVIQPAVESAEHRRATSRPTQNMNSYELFLRARRLSIQVGKVNALEALALLDRAIELDPAFAMAKVHAAVCHTQVWAWRWADDIELHYRAAHALVTSALSLSGEDAEVLQYAAGALSNLGENHDAHALIEHALTLNPGIAVAWFMSGLIRQRMGMPKIAIERIRMSMRLDPMSPFRALQLWGLGEALMNSRRFDDAVVALTESVRLNPDLAINLALLAACQGQLGDLGAARQTIARLEHVTGLTQATIAPWGAPWGVPAEIFLEGMALAQGEPAPLDSRNR